MYIDEAIRRIRMDIEASDKARQVLLERAAVTVLVDEYLTLRQKVSTFTRDIVEYLD